MRKYKCSVPREKLFLDSSPWAYVVVFITSPKGVAGSAFCSKVASVLPPGGHTHPCPTLVRFVSSEHTLSYLGSNPDSGTLWILTLRRHLKILGLQLTHLQSGDTYVSKLSHKPSAGRKINA